MLILERKINESIVIGDPAKPIGRLMITKIAGEKVWIGFDMPRDVQINRAELADAKVNGKGDA